MGNEEDFFFHVFRFTDCAPKEMFLGVDWRGGDRQHLLDGLQSFLTIHHADGCICLRFLL